MVMVLSNTQCRHHPLTRLPKRRSLGAHRALTQLLSAASTTQEPVLLPLVLPLRSPRHNNTEQDLQLQQESEAAARPGEQSRDIFTDADWDNLMKGYTSQYVEHDFWVDDSMVEGTIPADLEGTLLRNGPGLFEVGGTPIGQPFDGDGMVCSWAFRGGRCFFRNRYVRTDAFVAEQEAGRMLFRGAFSCGNPSGSGLFNPLDMRIKSIANTNVIHWGGRTLALHERDVPWELDSALCTLGRTRLGDTLQGPSTNFGAHVRYFREEDGSKRLIGTTFGEGLTKGTLTFLEYSQDMQLLHRTTVELPGGAFGFFHDMLVTERYYIALENPMQLDLPKMAFQYTLGRACLAECLKFNPRGRTKIHLIPRPGRSGKRVERRVLETEPLFCFHHVNAYETVEAASGRKERVILDCLAMKDGVDFGANFGNLSAEFFQHTPWRTAFTRLSLDPMQNTVEVSRIEEDRSMEMPMVAPECSGRPYRYAYALSSRVAGPNHWGAPQDITKVTLPVDHSIEQHRSAGDCGSEPGARVERWSPGRDSFAQEPIFVPGLGRGNGRNRTVGNAARREDDGWLLAPVLRSATMTTDLVILDAADLAAGPVATIHLPLHIPIGLHGSFTDSYLGPSSDDTSSPRHFDIRQGVSRNKRPQYSR